MRGSFCIADLSEVSRKKQFFDFTVFQWAAIKYRSEAKYFHNKCSNKRILIEKTLKLVKSKKAKKK